MSSLDPLADLLPAHHPTELDTLPEAARRLRFRLFLATWAVGAPEDLSWATALNDDPVHVAESIATLRGISDDALRAAVADRMNRQVDPSSPDPLDRAPMPSPGELLWDKLLAESRAGGSRPSRVTVLVTDRKHRERA